MKAGDVAELKVESLTLEGEGVGKLAEREVHARGVFPGERAEVRIEAVSKHHPRAHARLVELTKRSPQRRRAPCERHVAREGQCTGCALMELDEKAQRRAKRTMLQDRFGLTVERIEPGARELGYRFSSKRVAFGRKGFVYLGSFAHGSHLPANMRGCLVDHPLLVAAFDALEDAACRVGMVPFDEKSGRGDLRYAWAKTNGSEVILTVTTASQDGLIGALVPLLEGKVAGLLHSVQGGTGNALRGSAAVPLFGRSEVLVQLLGERVEVGALGFVQPNPEVAGLAYQALTDTDAPGELAFDLYAGAGVTTRMLRQRFARVLACESHPESARALDITPESVESFLERVVESPSLVIANPPRKGLGPVVCAALLRIGAPALHVMSCGPDGLARDLTALAPGYELRSLQAFDTLPQTPHVELVAKLTRRA